MTELINKEELLRRFADFGREIPKDIVIGVIASIKEEVVRCKDCKYWHINTEFCSQFSHKSAGIAQRMPPNDFCSYGERRDNERHNIDAE